VDGRYSKTPPPRTDRDDVRIRAPVLTKDFLHRNSHLGKLQEQFHLSKRTILYICLALLPPFVYSKLLSTLVNSKRLLLLKREHYRQKGVVVSSTELL